MTDYIITEELYLLIRSDLYNNGYIDRYHQLKREVQSRPLHAELQKERERVLDELQSLSSDDISSIISYIESCCYWNTDNPTIDEPHVQILLMKLESLRGEL